MPHCQAPTDRGTKLNERLVFGAHGFKHGPRSDLAVLITGGGLDQGARRMRATRSWPKAVRMARYIKPVAAMTAE